MNKVTRILGITFMSVMTGLFTIAFFSDTMGLFEMGKPIYDGVSQYLIPILLIDCLAAISIVTLGIIGIVTASRNFKENTTYNLVAGSMMILTFFGAIETLQLFTGMVDAISRSNESSVDAPDFPIFPILTSIIVCTLFTITLFMDYKKKPLPKCILHIVAFGLLTINFLINGTATKIGDSSNNTQTIIAFLTLITFIGFLVTAVMGIVSATVDRKVPEAVGMEPVEESPAASNDIVGKLKTLKELHDAGVLDDEEYREKSSKYIDLL